MALKPPRSSALKVITDNLFANDVYTFTDKNVNTLAILLDGTLTSDVSLIINNAGCVMHYLMITVYANPNSINITVYDNDSNSLITLNSINSPSYLFKLSESSETWFVTVDSDTKISSDLTGVSLIKSENDNILKSILVEKGITLIETADTITFVRDTPGHLSLVLNNNDNTYFQYIESILVNHTIVGAASGDTVLKPYINPTLVLRVPWAEWDYDVGGGFITYTGDTTRKCRIQASIICNDGGNSHSATFRLEKIGNDDKITEGILTWGTSASTSNLTLTLIADLETNDIIRIRGAIIIGSATILAMHYYSITIDEIL